MKRIVMGISFVLLVAAASLLPGRAQDAATAAANQSEQPPTHNWAAGNPLKIALLKWYQANSWTTTFNVGKTKNSNPYGVAFDGANIWTANSEGTVTKLRASDGANLGNFEVGGLPTGIAFDGANMWVTDNSPNGGVTKVRASDGKILGTFPVGGQYPFWLAFDGENVWVANSAGVTKLRASDGRNLGTFNVGNGAFAVAFDGTYVWVTGGPNLVTKLKRDGSSAGQFQVGRAPYGIAFDGANIWVAISAGQVSKLRASDGTTVGTFNVPCCPYGLAFDGYGHLGRARWRIGGAACKRRRNARQFSCKSRLDRSGLRRCQYLGRAGPRSCCD